MRLAMICPKCLNGFVVETPEDADVRLIGNHTGLECPDCTSCQWGHTAWMVMVEDRCRFCEGKGVRDVRACPACRGSGRLVAEDGRVPSLAYDPRVPACRHGHGCDVCRSLGCACYGCEKRGECQARAEPRQRCVDAPEPAIPPDLVEPPPGTLAPLVAVVEWMGREVEAERARSSPWRFVVRVLMYLHRRFADLSKAIESWAWKAGRRVPTAPCSTRYRDGRVCGEPGTYDRETDTWCCEECEIPF